MVGYDTSNSSDCMFICLCRICHTTREPYYGEENGIDYHFVSEEDFQNMVHMVSCLFFSINTLQKIF